MNDRTTFAPDVAKWDAWRPEEVRRRLASVEAPWCVTAGWAIDLFLGAQRREHEDIEIAVPRDRLGEILGALAGYEFFAAGVPGPGLVTPLALVGDAADTYHQTWVREPATGVWRLDVFREPSDGDTWICRRDDGIRLPYDELIERTPNGIPYGRPEIVLLFKAKHAREKDDDDLAAVLPHLEPTRRRWLADALALVHPGHRWSIAQPAATYHVASTPASRRVTSSGPHASHFDRSGSNAPDGGAPAARVHDRADQVDADFVAVERPRLPGVGDGDRELAGLDRPDLGLRPIRAAVAADLQQVGIGRRELAARHPGDRSELDRLYVAVDVDADAKDAVVELELSLVQHGRRHARRRHRLALRGEAERRLLTGR